MSKVKIFIGLIVIILGSGLGYHFNSQNGDSEINNVEKSKVTEDSDKSKNHSFSQEVTTIDGKEKNTDKLEFNKPYYRENEYLSELSKNPDFRNIYNKSQAMFGEYKFGEDLSVWLAIGIIFDSSAEYGEIFEKSISKLNEQKSDVFLAVSNKVNSLNSSDSFLRQQLINVVGVMSIEKAKKISFFGSEISRKVYLDKNGDFSADSMNITNSIAFLRQTGATLSEARNFFKQSLAVNPDPIIQESLIVRFNTYFPGIFEDN